MIDMIMPTNVLYRNAYGMLVGIISLLNRQLIDS